MLTNAEAKALYERLTGVALSRWTFRRIDPARLPYTRTPGGHRRYLERDVETYAQEPDED